MKISLLLVVAISAANTATAFLPLGSSSTAYHTGVLFLSTKKDNGRSSSSKDQNNLGRVDVGRKERYIRLTPEQVLTKLEKEYMDLKEQLRRDLFQLKHQQKKIFEEEDALLQEERNEIELERFTQELDAMAAHEDYEFAHRDVLEAQDNFRAAWMDSQEQNNKHVQTLSGLKESFDRLLVADRMLEERQKAERQAQLKETRAGTLLKFLEEQEEALREISKDPHREQLWAQEKVQEIENHHQSVLQVAAMERETENLWNQLREDLVDLKRQQLQVVKEEQQLSQKETEIVDYQIQKEKEQLQTALAEMKKTHEQVKQAVARKEQAYKDTLDAIDIGDKDPTELWMLSEAALEKSEAFQEADAVKDKLTRLVAKEAQAEDLLMLLERKAFILKELRLPGHEEDLHKWVKDELSNHESMLNVVKDKLILFDE